MKVVRRMLAEGPDGFKGGINARVYGSLKGHQRPLPHATFNTLWKKEFYK